MQVCEISGHQASTASQRSQGGLGTKVERCTYTCTLNASTCIYIVCALLTPPSISPVDNCTLLNITLLLQTLATGTVIAN